jgi:chaperone modulatory protein CbpM
MMITETEIVARFASLEVHILERWIAAGWLKPQRSGSGLLFDETDVARTHLLCDLCYDMELRDDDLPMVLSLLDQLHGTRGLLRAMISAVRSQPEEVRVAVMRKARELLASGD